MSATAEDACPVCGDRTLGAAHCPSPACRWRVCRSKRCQAVLDLDALRGHALAPDGTRRKVTLRRDA